MLMCPQCGSVRVTLRGAGGGLYSLHCQECRYGWEAGRWKPQYAEEDETRRGWRDRSGALMSPACQLEEGADL